ncbi:type IV secretion system protein VirB10 [Rhizobium sp. TRM95111]|uniref:type IV secretion system protein VirB10 n=1 Tax=Rhizobium alarense TaxID=2846851 RepID=UPI001F2B55C3|nr:type IV secretion system protein VirB10 [Rhizobium alarense]MCF3642951.1 type IV secretion system protein VirB10 [Rhizobium alarense]
MNQPNAQPELNAFDGERGVPSVNNSKPSSVKRIFMFLAIVLFVIIIGILVFLKSRGSASEEEQQRNVEQTSTVPTRTFTLPANPRADEEVRPELPQQVVPVVQSDAKPSLPGEAGAEAGQATATLDKSAAPLMASGSGELGSGTGSAQPQNAGSSGAGGLPASGNQSAGSGGALSGMLTGTQTDPRKAGMLGNRNFLLAKGSFIDCALRTRLDSTVPGMTSCVVTRNIYSDNGKVLLIERGSEVTGEYQSNLRQGMARIFVLWTRVKTPNGVVVNLDSPGADPLGGAGLPGHVNNHFWKRFGGALMLSLVDDVARYATQNSSSDSQINFNSTGDATSDMAAEALRNTINIPPTLYKNQGEQVGIYVSRDLDFSSVYDVQPK